ncbi:RNA polymerase sigma factor [Sulfuriroseicoccus oceanibius]|uniref:Sigma-70 family RNA polymerase sigma factor n=1 Tax=Sulfuriroseicoccus oceanibius TaxID=2707525 RepID=A0A6B3L7P6_9BACT|nr:sigma-70 family RNA polymerase sigma factor [Sulfuriroseicoccus oceanibius]QQL44715.1 sigma-70 family RNA polymerase sigma factor [Sulfuriroseicoccus oceanibius]
MTAPPSILPLNEVESAATKSAGASSRRRMLEQLFRDEESALLRFAYGIVHRREVAEELVQDGFIQLFRHAAEVENPRAWLYRAVRNLALNYLRKHKRESLWDDMEDEGPVGESNGQPDEEVERMERVGLMRMCVAGLPEGERTMLKMKFEDGCSYKEIAERLQLSVGNVGYKLHHVIKRLATEMNQIKERGAK